VAQHARRSTRARSRGLLVRGFGIVLGLILGVGVILAASAPLALADPRVALTPGALAVSMAPSTSFAWPTEGSGAVAVPALGVNEAGPTQTPAPIASLTKLMTAYVVLQHLPLSTGESGPCLVTTAADVATYNADQHSDQSSVKVVAGTTLCELDLLNGLFVHSANNFAELLVQLCGLDDTTFISEMNAAARTLGMTETTYVDVSGIGVGDVSTAQDQMLVVVPLMANPLVRTIVAQTSVEIPGAGVVRTYTPLLGTKGVVGIKSGRTDEAGGCDAMALMDQRAGEPLLIYSVVLGQRHGDLLTAAGDAAYALATSAERQIVVATVRSGQSIGSVGWSGSTSVAVVNGTRWFVWWRTAPTLLVKWRAIGSTVPAGQVVATLAVPPCEHCTAFGTAEVTTQAAIEQPPWWNGLR
jgi:D-alanyl-D-alanine carboxypeptidase (penicillin-binding protein 5/6)